MLTLIVICLFCISPLTYLIVAYYKCSTKYKLENELFSEIMNDYLLNGTIVRVNYDNATIEDLHTSDTFLVDSSTKISDADMRSRFRVYKINSNNYQTTIWDYDNTFLTFKNEYLLRKFRKKVKLAYDKHMKDENIKKIERLKENLYGEVE